MFAYRYVPYLPLDSEHPILPFVSFSELFEINKIPTIPIDMMETHWYEKRQFAFHVSYCNWSIYYFILPAEHDLPNNAIHRRLRMEISSDPEDHHCDYYAKAIIKRFMERMTRRLNTQQHVRLIRQTIQAAPDTSEYYEEFLRSLKRVCIGDCYDISFFQHLMQEVQDIVDTERRYRPGGDGYQEAQQHFMESVSLSL